MGACYFLKVAGGVTPDAANLNNRMPVTAVPLAAGGVAVAEGAWNGGWGQAHVLPPLVFLVCLLLFGVARPLHRCIKRMHPLDRNRAKVHVNDASTSPKCSPNQHRPKVMTPAPVPSPVASDSGAGKAAMPGFAAALDQGLIVNVRDDYEMQASHGLQLRPRLENLCCSCKLTRVSGAVQEHAELQHLQREMHAVFAGDASLVERLGAERVAAILAAVGEPTDEDLRPKSGVQHRSLQP